MNLPAKRHSREWAMSMVNGGIVLLSSIRVLVGSFDPRKDIRRIFSWLRLFDPERHVAAPASVIGSF